MLRDGIGFDRVVIRCGRTDLRKGIDGLKSLIMLEYGMNPLNTGTLFLFCGSNRRNIKGLIFEGDGFSMITKRLSDGFYQWPRNSDEARLVSKEEFIRLMEGYTVDSSIKIFPHATENLTKAGPQ